MSETMPAPPRAFSMDAIYNLPEPEIGKTAQKTIDVKGVPLTLTIRADGKEDSALWYAILGCFPNGIVEPEPLWYTLPPPKSKKVEITDPLLLTNLRVLATVLVSPALQLEDLAEIARQAGPEVMEEVYDWAVNINGIGPYLLKKLDALKKTLNPPAPGRATSGKGSLKPASTSSARSPHKR